MIPDLFAGPGGWSEGLRMIGMEDVGLELDHNACRTRVAAGHATIRTDVSTYPIEPFMGRATGLIASPPCTAFSMAGKGKGRDEIAHLHAVVEAARTGWGAAAEEARARPWADATSALVLEPLRWAWALRDTLEWVACEQVPPVFELWRHMADVIRSWGWDATAVILNAEEYGVPQTRTRAFLLAHRERVRVPKPTHQRYVKGIAAGAAPECAPSLFGPGVLPWVSMAEALGWTGGMRTGNNTELGGERRVPYGRPTDDPAPTVDTKAGRSWEVNTGRDWKEGEGRESGQTRSGDEPAPTVAGTGLRAWQLNPGRTDTQPNRRLYTLDEPAPAIAFGHDANNWKWERWTEERPATTVVGSFGRDVVSPPGHRDMGPGAPSRQDAEGAVRILPVEAAVLQSFPPDYPFQGSKTSKFAQIGNAVPPRLAAHVIRALTGG